MLDRVTRHALALVQFALFFVYAEPQYFWFGAILVALGSVASEIAGVNYNAMLQQVSTPRTIGRVSGFGWGMGYVGGIVLLLIVYFGFIEPIGGSALFGVPDTDGLPIRATVLVAALWYAVFALPVLLAVPEYHDPSAPRAPRIGFLQSYVVLFRDVRTLWRERRHTVLFLIASAVFRDGLTGVFTFGGVLAAGSFGFSAGSVIIFAIAANVVAGISTILVGLLDDRIGAKPVMVGSLIGLVVFGILVFIFHDGGQTAFWIFGLALCAFVGPAQSASRSFLARQIPAGREGEIFGLYATTGKAATFLTPAMWAVAISIAGAVLPEGSSTQYWGILGIVLVLVVGLLLLIPVRAGAADADSREPLSTESTPV